VPTDPTPPTDPPAPVLIHPDLLAWARQTLDIKEVESQIRQIELTGGCTFESFIAELEARAGVS
jgi:hypothetical protein